MSHWQAIPYPALVDFCRLLNKNSSLNIPTEDFDEFLCFINNIMEEKDEPLR